MNTPATSLDSEISNLICMLREIRFLVPLYLRIRRQPGITRIRGKFGV